MSRYDDVPIMSGSHSGVQKIILSTVSNALYVHYWAHNLNTAKGTKEASKLFDTVQAIFNIFISSAPIWAALVFREQYSNKIYFKKMLLLQHKGS